jgi:hypothetical protein
MKTYVMIPRFAFWMVVSCFMVPSLCAQSVTHQDSVSQIVPPPPQDPSRPVKVCVGVLIEEYPSPYYKIVPGWGPDYTIARERAEENARKCSPTGNIIDEGYDDICEHVECPTCASPCNIIDAIATKAMPAVWPTNQCRIRGKLVYCDGTAGFEITFAGATYCETLQKARTVLCKKKDPCKRGYLKFCIESSVICN